MRLQKAVGFHNFFCCNYANAIATINNMTQKYDSTSGVLKRALADSVLVGLKYGLEIEFAIVFFRFFNVLHVLVKIFAKQK